MVLSRNGWTVMYNWSNPEAWDAMGDRVLNFANLETLCQLDEGA
jgi:hypothetical protein